MTDEEVQQGEAEPGAEAAPRNRRILPILGVVLSLVTGLGIGLWGVGPAAAERLAAPAGEESNGEGGDHDRSSSAVTAFTVDNLVLNPAGTQGTRFLMATIVATVEGDGATALEERDAEIRDHLMLLLGAKTVEELSDVDRREGLKREIRASLSTLVPSEEIVAVYLPTFVIQ